MKEWGKIRLSCANDDGPLRELVGHVRQIWGKTRGKPWKQAEGAIRSNGNKNKCREKSLAKSWKDS